MPSPTANAGGPTPRPSAKGSPRPLSDKSPRPDTAPASQAVALPEAPWVADGPFLRAAEPLGDGSFSRVYLGRPCTEDTERAPRTHVAIKVYVAQTPRARAGPWAHFDAERAALYRLQEMCGGHPNVVRMVSTYAVADEPRLVLGYCEGNLLDVLRIETTQPAFEEHDAREVMRHFLAALRFAHAAHVYHGDLKLENVLFERNPIAPGGPDGSPAQLMRQHLSTVRVADWGFATLGTPLDAHLGGTRRTDTNGTHTYVAPEVGTSAHGFDAARADVWSFGVCLYAALTKRLPWALHTRDPERAACARADHAAGRYPRHAEGITPLARDLLDRLFEPSPWLRPTTEELCVHRWFTATPRKAPAADRRPRVRAAP